MKRVIDLTEEASASTFPPVSVPDHPILCIRQGKGDCGLPDLFEDLILEVTRHLVSPFHYHALALTCRQYHTWLLSPRFYSDMQQEYFVSWYEIFKRGSPMYCDMPTKPHSYVWQQSEIMAIIWVLSEKNLEIFVWPRSEILDRQSIM